MHRKITQCNLHAGMRPYVHNKYFNWLALNMIQRYNTRARGQVGIRQFFTPEVTPISHQIITPRSITLHAFEF